MNVFNRLIAGATGTAVNGIRANLPSRFNPGERHDEINLSETPEDIQPAQIISFKANTDTNTNAPAMLSHPAPPLRNVSQPPVTSSVQETEIKGQRATGPPKPLIEATPRSALPPEVQTMDAPIKNQAPTHSKTSPEILKPAPDMPPARHVSDYVTTRIVSDAPEALLASAPTTAYSIPAALAAAPAQKSITFNEAQVSSPDINIHIGRIDLRNSTKKAAPTRAAPDKPSAMPSLSDYLNGKGS